MTFDEFKKSDISVQPGDVQMYAEMFMDKADIDHQDHITKKPMLDDLYLKKNEISDEIIRRLTTDSLLSTFTSQIDHTLWYELPFCYSEK